MFDADSAWCCLLPAAYCTAPPRYLDKYWTQTLAAFCLAIVVLTAAAIYCRSRKPSEEQPRPGHKSGSPLTTFAETFKETAGQTDLRLRQQQQRPETAADAPGRAAGLGDGTTTAVDEPPTVRPTTPVVRPPSSH